MKQAEREGQEIMDSRIRHIIAAAGLPWLSEGSVDISRYPIDSVPSVSIYRLICCAELECIGKHHSYVL